MKINKSQKKNPEIKPLPTTPEPPTTTPEITPKPEKNDPYQPSPEISPQPSPEIQPGRESPATKL